MKFRLTDVHVMLLSICGWYSG